MEMSTNFLAACLIDLVSKEGTEILYDTEAALHGLAGLFKRKESLKGAVAACLNYRYFPHAFYKSEINEILLARQGVICYIKEQGASHEDAVYATDGFTILAESLRKIEILKARDEKMEKTYELLAAALRSYEKGNYKPAMMVFNSLAGGEVSEGCYYLGKCYFEGKSVAQDYARAAKNFSKSANSGLSHAIYYMGTCYLKGYGIKKNVDLGTELLIKAADMGQEDACFAVGFMHRDGAVNKDGSIKSQEELKKAIAYLQISADYGNWSSAIAICDLYYEDAKTTGNFNKTSKARERMTKATAPEDCFKIAQIYEKGIGVAPSMEKALNFSTKAAAKGHKGASEMMARIGNARLGR